MNAWLVRGLLLTGALSLTAFTVHSARAASAQPENVAGENSAKGETPLGNLVADALKLATKSEVALVQAGLLEERSLPANAGPNAAKVALASPNEGVMVVRVSGRQLQGALERSVSLAPRKNQGFLQVAGLAIVFDLQRPEGRRILDVKVNGAALKPDATYNVAMPESLAHGALGYFRFWDDKNAKPFTVNNQKLTLIQALSERLKQGRLPTKVENRIKAS